MIMLTRTKCGLVGAVLSTIPFFTEEALAKTFVLPVAARAQGVDGMQWRTWTEQYIPSIPGRENESIQVNETVYSAGLAPRAFFFRMRAGEGARGGDEILEGLSAVVYQLPDDWRLLLSARIFYKNESGEIFGQVVRGMPVEELLTAGERAVVVTGDGGGQRSNVGWFQYESGTVLFRLLEADGRLVHEEQMSYGDGAVWGAARLFGEPLDGSRILEAEVLSGSGIGYVSIIDIATGDPEFRYFQRVSAGCEK